MYLNITHFSSVHACALTHVPESMSPVFRFLVRPMTLASFFTFSFQKYSFIYFYVFMLCLYVCLCTMCKAVANREQKMALDTLKNWSY